MIKRLLPLLFATACLKAGTVSAAALIVADGQPRAEIVIALDPPRMVKLAAVELQAYLEKITGARLPVVTVPGDAPVKVYVGRSVHTDRLGLDAGDLDHGAYRMVSRVSAFERGENWLVLLGRDRDFTPPEPHMRDYGDRFRAQAAWDRLTGEKWSFPHGNLYKEYNAALGIWERDERGSLNAVYAFLGDLGVRWYLPDELGEIVPRQATVALPTLNRTVYPDFALRYPYQYGRMFAHEAATREEVLWQLRLGVNHATGLIGMWEAGMSHGLVNVHAREEVKQAHPEYYAMAGGRRDTETFGGGRPCLSSEGLLGAYVRYARAMFDIYGAPMVSAMPQDGYTSVCQCPLCADRGTAARGWAGQISDYVWAFVDRAGRELQLSHPDRKINCFAYGSYALPPENIERLSPNVMVGIAQNRALFHDPERRAFHEDLRRAWQAKLPAGSRFCIWEYYLQGRPDNPYAGVPAFFTRNIARDLRALRGISIGDFIEVYRGPGLEDFAAAALNLYVTARFWWDADQDLDALLDEYYTLFYGPAAGDMKAFTEYCEANWMQMPRDTAVIARALELLARAGAAVEPGSVQARRVALMAGFTAPLQGLRERLAGRRQNVPEAVIPVLPGEAPVTLDGRLDDAAWQAAPRFEFKALETGAEPAQKGFFRAFWASGALYLGIECRESDMAGLNIGAVEHGDPNVWNGDCVEIMLETQTHSYYQLAVSPAGALVDLDHKDGLNTLWSSGAEVAAHAGPDSWSLEIRLPAAGELQRELDPLAGVAGAPPTRERPWFFNICRQRLRDAGPEFTGYAPTPENHFHDLDRYGKIFLE